MRERERERGGGKGWLSKGPSLSRERALSGVPQYGYY
jgi:hypothetical protein